MKEKLHKVLSFIHISQFSTCVGWQNDIYNEDYYRYFDSKDELERRGSILIFVWMLYGWWNKAEFPFKELQKEDYPNSITPFHHHDFNLYIESLIKCKDKIAKNFPITFYSIRWLINELLLDGSIEASSTLNLSKLEGFNELFCTESFKQKYYYEDIVKELEVDMINKKLEKELYK